jgi:hypothetical protein
MPGRLGTGSTLVTLALLAGCASNLPTAVGLQRGNRLQLQENISTQQDVFALLGPPGEVLDMPRLAVPAAVRDRCMAWDQRAIRAIVYVDSYLNPADRQAWGQETEVFLRPDGRVCTWVVWTWHKGLRGRETMTLKG